MISLKKGDPIPANLGIVADEYHDVRELRLAMEREAATVKERETELHAHLIDNLSKSENTGIAGQRYRAQLKGERFFSATDWPQIYAFVRQTGAFEVLERRLSSAAAKEYYEANNGLLLPGVSTGQMWKVSVTKI